MVKTIDSMKTRVLGSANGVSAIASTIGSSWNVCHSICLAVISILAGIGIVITGMPLLFLFQYNLYLWGLGLVLLLFSLAMLAWKPNCMPKNLLLFNSGMIIAGVPQNLLNIQPFSWIAGGGLALAAIELFLLKKYNKKGGVCHG